MDRRHLAPVAVDLQMCRVRRDARSLNVRGAGKSRAMETSSRNLNKVRRDAPYGTETLGLTDCIRAEPNGREAKPPQRLSRWFPRLG